MTPSAVWSRRRQRVARLRAERPHTAELLAFYDDVLALQEPLYAKALKSRWLEAVEAADGRAPRLRLELLPERSRARDFARFVRALPTSATEVLRAMASRLASEPAAMSSLLSVVLGLESIDAVAARLDCDAAALEFFPRAFLQPLAEAAAEQCEQPDGAAYIPGFPARCPCCGRLPLLDLLQDEPETKGARHLLCALCATTWRFPRAMCPACGETRAAQMRYHETDEWPHLRVGECTSCATYLKTVDLRTDGLAVPPVDELAAVELDLWAEGQGLGKLQRNLLGL